MSDILGTGEPKLIGTGSPDSTTRILYYSILDPQFSEKVFKIFESPVSASGKRTYKTRGRYATFSVDVLLCRYVDNSLAIGSLPTAKQMASTLLSYEDKDVVFYPFKDGATYGDGFGKPIKNAANVNVNCRLIDVNFSFLENISGDYDVITLICKTHSS